MELLECVKIAQQDFSVHTIKEGATDYAAALLSGLTVTTKSEYIQSVIARALALQHNQSKEF